MTRDYTQRGWHDDAPPNRIIELVGQGRHVEQVPPGKTFGDSVLMTSIASTCAARVLVPIEEDGA